MLFKYGDIIQPYYVPLLEELVCPTNFAPFLVPGRPIKRLFLVWPGWRDAPNGAELMEEMARSTESIKRLGLFLGWGVNWQVGVERIFSAAAAFHQDVEELTVWFVCWKESAQILKRLLRELSENLRHFPKLRVLDLNGSVGYGVAWFDHRRNAISAAYTNILQPWSNDCPNLERVVFPNGSIWVKEPISNCLSRSDGRVWPLSLEPKDFSPHADVLTVEEKAILHLENTHNLDSNLANAVDPDSLIFNGLSDNDPDIEITTAFYGEVELPNKAPEAKTATCYKWRCLNPYFPHRNRPKLSYATRSQGPELGWDTSMFKRDLKKGWPKELPFRMPEY